MEFLKKNKFLIVAGPAVLLIIALVIVLIFVLTDGKPEDPAKVGIKSFPEIEYQLEGYVDTDSVVLIDEQITTDFLNNVIQKGDSGEWALSISEENNLVLYVENLDMLLLDSFEQFVTNFWIQHQFAPDEIFYYEGDGMRKYLGVGTIIDKNVYSAWGLVFTPTTTYSITVGPTRDYSPKSDAEKAIIREAGIRAIRNFKAAYYIPPTSAAAPTKASEATTPAPATNTDA